MYTNKSIFSRFVVINRKTFIADVKGKYMRNYSDKYSSLSKMLVMNDISDSTIYNTKQNFENHKDEVLAAITLPKDVSEEDLGLFNAKIFERTLKLFRLKDSYSIPVNVPEEEPTPDKGSYPLQKSADPDILKVIAENLAMQNRLLAEISETLKSMDESWKAQPKRQKPISIIKNDEPKKEVVG